MVRKLAAAAALLTAAQTAAAQDEGPGLIELLRLMPVSEDLGRALQLFSYVDFRAIEAATGVPTPDAERHGGASTFADWPQEDKDAWFHARLRVTAGPRDLVAHAGMIGRSEASMEDATGVDYFAIDRSMTFDEHADVTLMAGDAPIASVEDMSMWSDLKSRGFVLGALAGVPVWHRFADDANALLLSDEGADADPFDADRMHAVRLAVLPDALVLTRNWPDLEQVLAIRAGTAEPSPVVPLLERMIAAALTLDGVGDRVLQAWATPVFSLMPMGGGVDQMLSVLTAGPELPDPEALEGLIDATRPIGDPLPPYPLALFLDLQDENGQVNAIALPYAERAQAEIAARVLADRLRTWNPPQWSEHEPFVTTLGATLETLVVDAPDVATDLAFAFLALGAEADEPLTDAEIREQTAGIDGAIAVVAARYPIPETVDGPIQPVAGRLLQQWLRGISYRDFTLLSVP